MKCWSRSTLGVVVGILNIVGLIGVTIYFSIILANLSASEANNYQNRNETKKLIPILSIAIAVCLIMTIINGVFVVGIIKRRHKLMIPWLILSAIGFVVQCGRFLFAFLGAIFSGVSFLNVVIIFVVSVIVIGIEALILWPIFKLFGDIRKNNIERGDRINK